MVRLSESTVYCRTKCAVDSVKKLNLWGCEIDDISICEEMKNLEVLSLSVNKVSSLKALKDCSKLRELYLRKNNIADLSELEHLKGLKNLQTLWLDENPATAIGEYRHKVLRILPQLTKLDDKAVTQEDFLEPEESILESCDMQASFYSTRSSRSSAATIHNDLMTRSLYVSRGQAICQETVMQPQMASFVDGSDEEPMVPSRSAEDDWGDFSVEEPVEPPWSVSRGASMDAISSRMCVSMYGEERPRQFFSRSVSVPRRRVTPRQVSVSPHRQHRLAKILSAVSVLMDELDPEGLRDVIEEAQRRIKKQR